jgi:hypothetical protein
VVIAALRDHNFPEVVTIKGAVEGTVKGAVERAVKGAVERAGHDATRYEKTLSRDSSAGSSRCRRMPDRRTILGRVRVNVP